MGCWQGNSACFAKQLTGSCVWCTAAAGQHAVLPPAGHSSLNASSSSKGLLLVGQTAVKVLHLQQPDIAVVNLGKPPSRGPQHAEGTAACTTEASGQQQGASWHMQSTEVPEEAQVVSNMVAARQEESTLGVVQQDGRSSGI